MISRRFSNFNFECGRISVLMTQYLSNQKLGVRTECGRIHCHCQFAQQTNYLLWASTCYLRRVYFRSFTEFMMCRTPSDLRVILCANEWLDAFYTSCPKPTQTNNKLADYIHHWANKRTHSSTFAQPNAMSTISKIAFIKLFHHCTEHRAQSAQKHSHRIRNVHTKIK